MKLDAAINSICDLVCDGNKFNGSDFKRRTDFTKKDKSAC
jgi:hypothetical protein